VQDSGIGIKAEQQHNLFDAFTQADMSNSREYGGAGLGLATSKQLVELMGGQIKVDSKLGKGSCFSFCIPVQIMIIFMQDVINSLDIEENSADESQVRF